MDSQWWFWTSAWQEGEREADEQARDGSYEQFLDSESFLASF
jgi:hypothetical protein